MPIYPHRSTRQKAGFVSLQRQRAVGIVNLECFPDFNNSFLLSKIILSDFLGFLEAANLVEMLEV